MRAVVRGLAVAVVVAGGLAAAAGCQNGGSGSASESPPATTAGTPESTPAASASVFLGKGGDESVSQISVPRARVGEPTGEEVTVVNPSTGEPVTIQHIAATTDNGETSIVDDTCTGVELPPGGTCRVWVRHIASEAGQFSGQLTTTTSDGNVLTTGISGEALGEIAPSGEGTTGTGTPSPSPSPSPTTETGPGTPEPSPTDAYPPALTGGSRS